MMSQGAKSTTDAKTSKLRSHSAPGKRRALGAICKFLVGLLGTLGAYFLLFGQYTSNGYVSRVVTYWPEGEEAIVILWRKDMSVQVSIRRPGGDIVLKVSCPPGSSID